MIRPNLTNPPMASVSKDVQAFKKTYRRTGSVKTSALAAGYSDKVASMGITNMPKAIRSYVLTRRKKLSKLALLGSQITPEEHENIARGAYFANIAAGKDQATQSIRLAMQDKRVSMLTQESATGVIVINAAPIPSFDSIPGHSVTPTVTPIPELPE